MTLVRFYEAGLLLHDVGTLNALYSFTVLSNAPKK